MGELSRVRLTNGTTHAIRDRHYVECTSGAGTQNKSVSIENFALVTGAKLTVKFIHTNTAANPKLSVNGGSAYPIVLCGGTPVGALASESWNNGGVVDFVFDGQNFIAQNLSHLHSLRSEMMSMVGSPLKANVASEMVDTTKIYVYVGSETGYIKGDWYYYNTTNNRWADGGPYNSAAIDVASVEEIEAYLDL